MSGKPDKVIKLLRLKRQVIEGELNAALAALAGLDRDIERWRTLQSSLAAGTGPICGAELACRDQYADTLRRQVETAMLERNRIENRVAELKSAMREALHASEQIDK